MITTAKGRVKRAFYNSVREQGFADWVYADLEEIVRIQEAPEEERTDYHYLQNAMEHIIAGMIQLAMTEEGELIKAARDLVHEVYRTQNGPFLRALLEMQARLGQGEGLKVGKREAAKLKERREAAGPPRISEARRLRNERARREAESGDFDGSQNL